MFLRRMPSSLISSLKTVLRFNRRPLMLSAIRGVKELPGKNKMRFNVGGVQAETREALITEVLEFMATEEGKKKMALWVGWGGTFTLGIGATFGMQTS